MTKLINPALKFPEWAPPSLVEEYRGLSQSGLLNKYAQIYLKNIETLCSNEKMEGVWREISKHSKSENYHQSLVMEITNVLLEKPIKNLPKKREQAALAAEKLRGLFAQMDSSTESILPLIGTTAWHAAINHFLDIEHYRSLPVESSEWAREITALTVRMSTEYPGVGSIDEVLSTISSRLRDPKYWPKHRDGSRESRAKQMCLRVGRFTQEICGQPLYGTIDKIYQIYYPEFQFSSRDLLRASGIGADI